MVLRVPGLAYQKGFGGHFHNDNSLTIFRDIPGIKKANMQVWGTGRVPGHGPFNLIETQTQVNVANLSIDSGDLIIGDEDGLTRIPIEIAEETLIKCEEVRQKESKSMSKEDIAKRVNL